LVDVEAVRRELSRFIARYHAAFAEISRRQAQLLEIGALTFAVEHYKKRNYTVHAMGVSDGLFLVKLGSQGDPRNYSWFTCDRAANHFDIYLNLPVFGSHGDGGIYVVDVGVVQHGALPKRRRGEPFGVDNHRLITFAEVKNFRIYPMLLAHFVGIVHELQPWCLGERRRYGFIRDDHFAPTLFTVGNITPNSNLIRRAYAARKYRLNIVPLFDIVIAQMSRDEKSPSPLQP
jgi:hypothetical protein